MHTMKRVRKLMETRLNHDSDRVETLERQLREARELAAESDRKFEEVWHYESIIINWPIYSPYIVPNRKIQDKH